MTATEDELKTTVSQNSILSEKHAWNQMGADGFALLEAIYAPKAPEWLRYLPAVEILRLVWVQQFSAPVDDQVRWRTPKDLPPSTIAIHSPHDVEAHYSSKRSVNWVGYKAHLTENQSFN